MDLEVAAGLAHRPEDMRGLDVDVAGRALLRDPAR
jgi:hypothetical protein